MRFCICLVVLVFCWIVFLWQLFLCCFCLLLALVFVFMCCVNLILELLVYWFWFGLVLVLFVGFAWLCWFCLDWFCFVTW